MHVTAHAPRSRCSVTPWGRPSTARTNPDAALAASGKVDGVTTVAFAATLPIVQEVFRRTIRLVDGEQGSRFLADIGAILREPGLALTMA